MKPNRAMIRKAGFLLKPTFLEESAAITIGKNIINTGHTPPPPFSPLKREWRWKVGSSILISNDIDPLSGTNRL